MKKLLFILPLLYYSCTDDIVADIDALQTENAEQDAQIDSLLTVLTEQQAYIDSLNNTQYIADSLNNLTMQSYIDSLINEGELTDSLLQVYTDSLNTVQNAYIDSLNGVQQTLIDALISTQPSTGENYVRIDSIQICWGINNSTQTTIIFNPIFSEVPTVILTTVNSTAANNYHLTAVSTTSATVSYNGSGYHWSAIGKWQ